MKVPSQGRCSVSFQWLIKYMAQCGYLIECVMDLYGVVAGMVYQYCWVDVWMLLVCQNDSNGLCLFAIEVCKSCQ